MSNETSEDKLVRHIKRLSFFDLYPRIPDMTHAARLAGIDTKDIRILQDIFLDVSGWTAEEYRAAQRQQHLKEINSPKLTTKDTTP